MMETERRKGEGKLKGKKSSFIPYSLSSFYLSFLFLFYFPFLSSQSAPKSTSEFRGAL